VLTVLQNPNCLDFGTERVFVRVDDSRSSQRSHPGVQLDNATVNIDGFERDNMVGCLHGRQLIFGSELCGSDKSRVFRREERGIEVDIHCAMAGDKPAVKQLMLTGLIV